MRLVVIGGGVAGCAAAVAAAAAGAEVVLVETAGHLGGVAARGEHRSICGLAPIDAEEPHLLEPELAGPWVSAISTGLPWRQGRVWLWPTSSDRLQSGCRERCRSAGVTLRLGTRVEACVIDQRRVHSVRTSSGDFPCDQVIDASGGAVVARACTATLRPALAWAAWRCEVALDLDAGLRARSQALAQVAKVLPHRAACALVQLGPGRWQLSIDVPPGAPTASSAAVAEAAATALGGTLLSGALSVAERDSGGWAGTMTAAECFAASERGLCWAAWPVEAHGEGGVTWRWPPADRHGLPRRVVQAVDAPENLSVVGRGMPVAADAMAALRVIGTQLALASALGQALVAESRAQPGRFGLPMADGP